MLFCRRGVRLCCEEQKLFWSISRNCQLSSRGIKDVSKQSLPAVAQVYGHQDVSTILGSNGVNQRSAEFQTNSKVRHKLLNLCNHGPPSLLPVFPISHQQWPV